MHSADMAMEALRECQSALAIMIAPDAIKQTTVINAFAQATAAEAKARTVLSALASSPETARDRAEKLGRFGHHPDPAIDFCIEVEALDNEVANTKAGFTNGTPSTVELRERAERAMEFRVGGDEGAVAAKATLRKASDTLGDIERAQSSGEMTDEDRIDYWKGAYDRMAARNCRLNYALHTIRDQHIPDQPASYGGSEYDWVVRQYANLRRIAKDASEGR